MGSPSARCGHVATRRHRSTSGQPGATNALGPVCERMALAGRSWSLLRPRLAVIRLRLFLRTLAGNRALTASPEDRTREKKRSGRGRPPWPPPPRRSRRTRGQPSFAPALINYAARCWLARMCCATPAPHPLPSPLSRLAQVGVAAS